MNQLRNNFNKLRRENVQPNGETNAFIVRRSPTMQWEQNGSATRLSGILMSRLDRGTQYHKASSATSPTALPPSGCRSKRRPLHRTPDEPTNTSLHSPLHKTRFSKNSKTESIHRTNTDTKQYTSPTNHIHRNWTIKTTRTAKWNLSIRKFCTGLKCWGQQCCLNNIAIFVHWINQNGRLTSEHLLFLA